MSASVASTAAPTPPTGGQVSGFYQVQVEGPVLVLELSLPDQIDGVELDRLNELLGAAVGSRASGRWVIDVTRTSYMGSAVLGLLVNLRQIVKQGQGKLVLCGMSEKLMRIFQTCSLERLFTITRGREDATRRV